MTWRDLNLRYGGAGVIDWHPTVARQTWVLPMF